MPYASGDRTIFAVVTPIVSVNRLFRGHGYQFVWHYETLRLALLRCGFSRVDRQTFGDGHDAKLLCDTPSRQVGLVERWPREGPAALSRKVAEADETGEVQIWGDGEQTRSFLYIDECLEGTVRLMRSNCADVLNIGSVEMVSTNGLVARITQVAGKRVRPKHNLEPLGVQGRNPDNRLIAKKARLAPERAAHPRTTKQRLNPFAA